MNLSLMEAVLPGDLDEVRKLLVEYASSLKTDLCFQRFGEELAGLPGAYAPPRGWLMLARVNDESAGCIALRPLSDDTCEMKRLYVRPAFRSLGVGRRLIQTMVLAARLQRYRRLRLDTLPEMISARRLYAELGFHSIAPYCHNPVEGVEFLELNLE